MAPPPPPPPPPYSPSSLHPLLGPHECHNPPPPQAPPAPASSFIDLMVANFDDNLPQKSYTENNSATFLSTGNPCLDFFFHVVPDTPPESLTQRLESAWAHDPLTALKLVCNLRGVRGNGKSDKEGFHAAARWLFKNHPRTLASNVGAFAEFGYFKDLPEILYRLLEGPDIRPRQNSEWQRRKGSRRRRKFLEWFSCPDESRTEGRNSSRTAGASVPKEVRVANKAARDQEQKQKASELRNMKRIAMARKLLERYKRDGDFRFLHDAVSTHFAHCLTADLEFLKSGEINKISLAAKWCPSLDSSFDLVTLLCESIAKRVFPRDRKLLERYKRDGEFRFLHDAVSGHFAHCLTADLEFLKSGEINKISLAAKWCPSLDSSFDLMTPLCQSIAKRVFPRDLFSEYEGLEEAHYAYRVRDRLRKDALVPLRRILELPEVYMSAGRWGDIPYNRVASVAMKLHKDKFQRHDGERFWSYLADVKSGKPTIAAGALLPHEIVASLDEPNGGEVAELQRERVVEDLPKAGKLENCIAVGDVSASLSGAPMEVSGKVITFSEFPQLHAIQGEGLRSKTEFIRTMDWGRNTDFQGVFDRILEVATAGKLRAEEMVRKVFVFSDMEFDKASTNPWETDYEAMTRKFGERGYGAAVPEFVFWNLRDSRSTPVAAKQAGVALVSGFSKNLMKMFLDDEGDVSLLAIMEAAISARSTGTSPWLIDSLLSRVYLGVFGKKGKNAKKRKEKKIKGFCLFVNLANEYLAASNMKLYFSWLDDEIIYFLCFPLFFKKFIFIFCLIALPSRKR
ncbi:hypothetical protein ACJRO7_033147 [Eucalyptus globulus]|uniref:DUF2828 domain-containing protein n=1 Tax=Eucalyptus globulus TaxID=34317 RepID=A0ABD3JSX7_EUCGL